MRVLLTTDTVGGVWTFTQELAQRLLLQGDDVALVSFGRSPSPAQQTWAETLAHTHPGRFALHARDTPLEWMQENDRAWQRGSAHLLQVADRFHPDILHSNQFCWGALEVALPKLITAHSDVRSWAAACRPQDLAASHWLTRYGRLVQDGLDAAHTIVAPTAWMREALRQSFRIDAPFLVIPNGRTIPPATLHPPRKLQAVSVGRLWDEGKGLSVLNDLAAPLPILLAGETSFESEPPAALGTGVCLLGPLEERSLLDLFRSSSLYLATSVYEPFGLAPLEAALCGCAIVARDLPSFREVWGSAALYFQDARSLQAILGDLVLHPRKLCALQTHARQRALRFDAQSMADGYRSLYQTMTQAATQPARAEELHAA